MNYLWYGFKTYEELNFVSNNKEEKKTYIANSKVFPSELFIMFDISGNSYSTFISKSFTKGQQLKNFETVKALLNMSTVEEGIEGEWFKFNDGLNYTLYPKRGLFQKSQGVIYDTISAYTFDKEYFIKPTVEEIVNFFENQVMEKTQTITRFELLEYIQSAIKLKPEILPVLQKHFPDVYTQKEFLVTKQIVVEVLEIIGDCREWKDKIKTKFKGLLQKDYNFKEGELVFVSDNPYLKWEIAKFKTITASYFYAIKNLSNMDLGESYRYCVPMREVPQGEVPKEVTHYNL